MFTVDGADEYKKEVCGIQGPSAPRFVCGLIEHMLASNHG